MKGYCGKVLRINLSTAEIKAEPIDKTIAYNFIGGRGYAAKLLYDELPPRIDALGEGNKIVLMTGPLTGTMFPGSGRLSVSSKSPLTGTIFDASVGGSFGAWLKSAGVDGIIVEGKSETPVYILINGSTVELKDASRVWGLSTSESEKKLRELHKNSRVIVIGPAGENCSYLANLMSDSRAAGRGGLGSVAGSKQLKAIVVMKGNNKVQMAHQEIFRVILKRIRRLIETHPITGKDGSLARFGTSLLVHRIAAGRLMPVDNFSSSTNLDYKRVDSFSGETVKEKYLVGRKTCFGCPTGCGRVIKLPNTKKELKGPEYESTIMLGPNSGFYTYEKIATLANLCDELGLDTISVGNCLGYARAIGLVKIKTVEDGIEFIKAIAHGKKFSRGVRCEAEKSGERSEAAEVKGLELPAYDPRAAKGIALAYATSNRGGCHLRAYTVAPEILASPEFVDPSAEQGKARLVKKQQDAFAVYDSAVCCKFYSFALFKSLKFELDELTQLLASATGFKWKDLSKVGGRIYAIERLFNLREGFGPKDDRLPKKFGVNLTGLLQEYYKERGWSKKEGRPPKPKLERPVYEKPILTSLFMFKFPQIQVALDLDAPIETICEIARKSYLGGARIIEAGTPTIKRHGCDRLLPALRKVVPNALLVADLKIMDVGNLEAKIAYRAGADAVAVLGIGSKNKIQEALSEAVKQDKFLLIDLIQCEDQVATLKDLCKQFRDYNDRVIFCLHKGISEQLKGRGIHEETELVEELRKIGKDFILAVAGGIKEGTVKPLVERGVQILIAGSGIYNSSNPKLTTKAMLEEAKKYYRPIISY